MGSIISGIFGTSNDFKADTGGQNYGQILAQNQLNQGQNIGNQNTLAQMLMAQASGAGANPAQAMLNQATNNNIKNTAATIASQRGINPGLAQRLIAENGAQQQQQAAGQAATMGAQQQLAAEGQIANVYGQIGNENLGGQQIAQNGLNNSNSVNSGVASQNADTSKGIVGGILSAGGAALGMGAPGKAHGGIIEGHAPMPGDSTKNDIVPAKLSPGEIVIPRSSASDPEKAKAFIDHIMSSKGGEEEASGYGAILKLKNRIAALEKKVGKK